MNVEARPCNASPATRWRRASRATFPNGAYVNLGIGLPTLVANHLPKDREIILHTENGLLGMGPAPAHGSEDPDLINAGKQPVTALPGASFFHHADSFAMMRGGHLDFCVLGAFQVSVDGRSRQLAHRRARTRFPRSAARWTSPSARSSVYVMMEHLTKQGESKIVARVHVSGHRARAASTASTPISPSST